MLDENALSKIRRNLKRCQSDPGKMVPAKVVKRDLTLLVADIEVSVYKGLFDKLDVEDHRENAIWKSGLEKIIPNIQQLIYAMAGGPVPGYVYEKNVKELLARRWEVRNNPETKELRVARSFMGSFVGEYVRLKDKGYKPRKGETIH